MDKALFEKEMNKDPRLAKGFLRQRFKLDEEKLRALIQKADTPDPGKFGDVMYYKGLLDACLSYKALLEKVNLL